MRKLLWLGLLIAPALAGCDSNVVFEANKAIPEARWKSTEPVIFEFEVTDTVSLNNYYINLRNGDDYAFMNLYLFVKMEFPNGRKSIDTLECVLADPQGRWLGSGLGDIYDNRFLYRSLKAFPIPGDYKIEINQAMRTDELPGIYDVGFRVARSDR